MPCGPQPLTSLTRIAKDWEKEHDGEQRVLGSLLTRLSLLLDPCFGFLAYILMIISAVNFCR